MKISDTDIAGLLSSRQPSTSLDAKATSVRKVQQKRAGQEVARDNELKCMVVVSKFGHLRISELARAVWPSARYAEQLAGRTVRRLLKRGLLLERRNSLGGRSLCITRPGATWLDVRGFEAQQTTALAVDGPTFFHRTLQNRYLTERQIAGQHVAGEYLILRRKLPFSIEPLIKKLKKLPDGFAWSRMADGTMALEWIEQEAASKARGELEKCLRVSECVGTQLRGDVAYKLSALVFVFDDSLNHAKRILLAANSLWGDRPAHERITLEKRVKLVFVEIRPPLVWVSHRVTTLHDYRTHGGLNAVAIRK